MMTTFPYILTSTDGTIWPLPPLTVSMPVWKFYKNIKTKCNYKLIIHAMIRRNLREKSDLSLFYPLSSPESGDESFLAADISYEQRILPFILLCTLIFSLHFFLSVFLTSTPVKQEKILLRSACYC